MRQKRKEGGQNRKTRGGGREGIWSKQQNHLRWRRKQRNGKDTRRVRGNESGNKRGNKGEAKRKPRIQERNRTTKGRI
jgi:hypothetical protein